MIRFECDYGEGAHPRILERLAETNLFQTCGYGEDEVLPWDTIDVGVSKAFLKRERRRAYEGKVTPDCRHGCAGCGANSLLQEVACDA